MHKSSLTKTPHTQWPPASASIIQSQREHTMERVQLDFERLEKLHSSQLAYLNEKVKAVNSECTLGIGEIKARIDELEGNAEKMLSVSEVAKIKNLSPRYVRELILQKKVSALPVGPNRFKMDLRMFNRELREVMMKSYLWRQAHEKKERRRVDFAA